MLTRQTDVFDACRDFWNGFLILSKARPWHSNGMTSVPGYIPYSEIEKYAVSHGYRELAELDLFVYLVQGLDSGYIEHMRKVAAAKNPKNPKTPPVR